MKQGKTWEKSLVSRPISHGNQDFRVITEFFMARKKVRIFDYINRNYGIYFL